MINVQRDVIYTTMLNHCLVCDKWA